jgi:hypothetical protein
MKCWCTVKSRNLTCLISLLILVGTLNIAKGSINFAETIQATASVSSPLVTLESVSNSEIFNAGTSANVTVSNETSNLNVLRILNQTKDEWQLQLIKYDESNIAHLTNCTIWFNNGSTPSKQIEISDGQFIQPSGDYYNLVGGGVDNITITASTNTAGTSYIYTHLKILKPNTSTYALYIITFEVT